MHEVVDPRVYEILRPLYVGLYWEWSALWALVAWHYGRSAYFSWRLAGGRPARVLADLAAPFTWGARQLLCRVGLLRGGACAVKAVPSAYGSGHMLRYAVFVGSLTPVLFGLMFSHLDRSTWDWRWVALSLAGVLVSCSAAMSHLFLAYREQPRKWELLVAGAAAWLVAAPPLIGLLGWA